MAFTVLIPARLASTRLPDKPLADIAGLPMVVRVAQRASLSGAQNVVVAADSERIIAACTEHGVRAILTRTDHVSGSDRLAEASAISEDFLRLMQSKGSEEGNPEVLEDAVAFSGVSKYPARIKCALLGWMAFKDASVQASK